MLDPPVARLRPICPQGSRTDALHFADATPFPHLVLHDLLEADQDELLASFPAADWSGWRRFQDEYQQGKMVCDDLARIPAPLADLIHELSGPSMLTFIEDVTGIKGLIPDPYLQGGGLHCSGPGGILAPHTDFHLYPRLGLYRRVNLLLYLNPTWEEDWGGCLELYQPGAVEAAKVIVPTWGTCVIFRTDDRSQHGFPRPITVDRWRRSIALYYYTAVEASRYSGDTNTYWRRMPVAGPRGRARQAAYDALLFGSRGIAFLAHRVDPNLSGRRKH